MPIWYNKQAIKNYQKPMRRIFILSIIGIFSFVTFQTVFAAAVFSDVASNHKNYNAIDYLHGKGVIQGYADNTFKPDQKVNRAEALKIILLGAQVLVPEIQSQKIFPDVLFGAWYAKYIVKARDLSIVKGDDKTNLFRPGDTVNLAEALKMLLKTNNAKTFTVTSNPYPDVAKDAWFAPYFSYASAAGLLDTSSKNNVYPNTAVTRGMLAELIYRLAISTYVAPDGRASFYGDKFHGKTTASGETFDASSFTAAHRTYPFNTWLKVTNTANGKSVVVRVNDRGPYTDDNRVIDLSKAAFESIASLSSGVIDVKAEKTSAPSTAASSGTSASLDNSAASPSSGSSASSTKVSAAMDDVLNSSKISCPDAANIKYAKKDTYTGLTLDSEIPSLVIADEVLTLKGKTISSNVSKVTAFIVDSSSNQTAFSGKVTNNYFEVHIRFPKEDTFKLGLLPGESGQSVVEDIKVLKNTCIEEVELSQLSTVSGLNIDLSEGDTVIKWNRGEYNLFKLTFTQNGQHKSYILNNLSEWRPVYREFSEFQSGNVTVSLRGGKLTKQSVLEPLQIVWSPIIKTNFTATTHHEYTVDESEITLLSLTNDVTAGGTISAVFRPKVYIRSEGALILPTGKVANITLTSPYISSAKNAFGVEVFQSSDKSVTASYTAQTNGVYFLEVNNDKGLAVLNVPIYPVKQFPLLPNARDLSSQSIQDLGTDLTSLRSKMLTLMNNDRQTYGLKSLTLDSKLNNLAQAKGDDMVINNYFSHWDKDGHTVNDLRLNYGIQTAVGENLAKDISLELAEYGLMRSAIHRANILSSEWTRVGFGVSKASDGSYIIVQLFSTDPLNMDDVKSLRSQLLDAINKNRTAVLAQKDNLNTLAQNWSEKMVNENFFDLTDKSNVTLIDTIHKAGVTSSLGTYILGNSSFTDALSQAGANAQLQDSKWKNLGIGVRQDNAGLIKITFIYTE